jgi:hypothetical protein
MRKEPAADTVTAWLQLPERRTPDALLEDIESSAAFILQQLDRTRRDAHRVPLEESVSEQIFWCAGSRVRISARGGFTWTRCARVLAS